MKAPFFVFDDGGATVAYPDLARLESDLSTLTDFTGLVFWDTDGQRLRPAQRPTGRTVIPLEPPEYDPDALRSALKNRLNR